MYSHQGQLKLHVQALLRLNSLSHESSSSLPQPSRVWQVSQIKSPLCMTVSVEELGIRVVLISCTWLLSIQTTQLSPFLHNQGEIVWTCCDWEIQVSSTGFELEFSPPQLNVLPLSYDAPYSIYLLPFKNVETQS